MNVNDMVTVSRAIAVEHRKEGHRCCHVAFLVDKRKKLISIGVNSERKSHPWNTKYNYKGDKMGTCAELQAVLRGKEKSYPECTMYVIRVNRENTLDLSRPCRGCMHLLGSMRLKQVYYTNREGLIENLY